MNNKCLIEVRGPVTEFDRNCSWIMNSPMTKTPNDNGVIKQKKGKMTSKNSSTLDTRNELADLIRKKQDIAVS